MEPERRQKALLGVLIVVLAAAGIYWLRSGPAASTRSASNVTAATGRGGVSGGVTAPDVHLEALESQRPRPGSVDRNLFRFKPRAAAPAEPSPRDTIDPATPGDGQPPAGAPPIALKFLGVMEAPERALRVAVLGDARGIYRGGEGDIIEGRYRIIRIGAESIEMTHLDGTGRQLIRLSGS
ncbi:MAG: hypothetical protein GEU82_09770 [Luteitalea sp.]|nr:hypothetical protein [Luteitalea sp.]